ncbi:UDP-glucosyltransferase 2-like [Homarus americanus]|uniref:UDP-glucosyltransferase 2-like n=1 Tax=Homarus americanus TaxID=6706 RepID=UPI001C43B687|nr:UDP-glucosyltransferase 2-like [Homarus americanus]
MMKAACLVVAATALMALGPPPATAADILVLTPFGSRSVRALFSVLTEGLVARGHTVTLLSSGEPFPRHPNVTHVVSPHSALDQMDLFEVREGGAVFRLWMKAFPAVAREMYGNPKVMELWRRRDKFDAVIVNSAANEMAFPFLLDITAPFITLSPAGTEPLQLSYLGNVVSPAALPSIVVPFDNHLSLWERLVNTLATILLRYSFRRTVGRPLAAALRDTFPDLPDPFELYPKQSLALLNRHHLLDGSVPLLPNQVEVGCMHCHPARPLPPDVAEWMEGAGEAGVVYFSLGSFQKTSRIPAKYREVLMEAFSRLPHRVLIKYGESDVQFPPNVRAFPWLPQQDILGHKNLRLFVTHCGIHSASEAVYHGVPVLGLPITFEQPRKCARIARRGEGLVLQWEQLTPEAIIDSVYTLVHDVRFRKRVEGVSRRLQAQKETGLERAVWWVEYVMEHGNDYLRFSGADLSLVQYLLLDVLAIIGGVALVIGVVLFFLARSIFKRFWPSSSSKAKLE